jgi:hypothetical protein
MNGELVSAKNSGVSQGFLDAFSYLSVKEKKRYIQESLRYLAKVLEEERINGSGSLIEAPYRLAAQAKVIKVHA